MTDEIRNALKVGSMVDTYRIEKILGHGGFGITYLAEDINLEKKVALKEYLPVGLAIRDSDSRVQPRSTDADSDYRWGLQQYMREARTLAKFHHPNIVQVLRFFEANGTAYIVMNFVEGQSLHDRMQRKKKIDEEELKRLLFPLLDGLEKVHGEGFLHRDIKPGNIFVTKDGTPVLLDFGAARAALKDKGRSLTAIVTRGYAPIEQYSSRGKQGPWTDIYALAGVLYEIVTNTDPVEATDRVIDDPQIPAAEAAKGELSHALLAAIDHALAVKPEHRPQTIADWRAELEGKVEPPPPPGPALREPAPAGAPAAAPIEAGSVGPPDPSDLGAEAAGAPPSSPPPRVSQGLFPRHQGPDGAPLPPRRRGGADTILAEKAGPPPPIAAPAPVPIWQRVPVLAGIAVLSVVLFSGLIWALLPSGKPPNLGPGGGEGAVTVPRALDFRAEQIRFAELIRRAGEEERQARLATRAEKPPQAAAALQSLFAGSQLSFARSLGVTRLEARWTLHPGGVITGIAFETSAGSSEDLRSIQDRGRWWVEGQSLCVRWNQWEGRQQRCYRIRHAGGRIYAATGHGMLAGSFVLEK